MKFLYFTKQNLNKQLYHTHVNLANTWVNSWQYIEYTVNDQLNMEMK